MGECWAILVAAGSGTRYGSPKQYELLADERVLDRSRRIAQQCCAGVVVVVPVEDVAGETAATIASGRDESSGCVVAGGSTRSESVRAGLAAVPTSATLICVHDAARPLASAALYEAVIDAVLAGADAAVPGVAVSDTIKVVAGGAVVVETLDRGSLVAVQTPQAFRATSLRAAHANAGEGTDDAALVERAGGRVVVVPGEPDNLKITVPDDLDRARALVVASPDASSAAVVERGVPHGARGVA